jgi:hypothetical protein
MGGLDGRGWDGTESMGCEGGRIEGKRPIRKGEMSMQVCIESI